MKRDKVLILPPADSLHQVGGPVAVVNLLKKTEGSDEHFTFLSDKSPRFNSEGLEKIRKMFSHQGILRTGRKFIWENFDSSVLGVLKEIDEAKTQFRRIKGEIESHDKIICMKLFLASQIIKEFPEKEIIVGYHGQGSRYNELTELQGYRENRIAKSISDRIEKNVYEKADKIFFPSRGSIAALKATNKSLAPILESRDITIVNNSIDQEQLEVGNLSCRDRLDEKKLTILTVSSLSNPKGIDRIPKILKNLREEGIEFQWILKSNGGEEEAKIRRELEKYQLREDTVWIDKRLERKGLMKLYSLSDVYMMAHRISIFDLATIEAMSHGSLPILSKVGGNKEFDRRDNIIFLDEISENLDILKNKEKLERLKEKNRTIGKNYFNLERMLNDYVNLFPIEN